MNHMNHTQSNVSHPCRSIPGVSASFRVAGAVIALGVLMLISSAGAKIDLVTLPDRDSTQLTIYNAADVTLVRDRRNLTLKKGGNKLQFSWANTLIDPTSLEMVPRSHAGDIDITELSLPPRVSRLGLWTIDSGMSGQVPMEITYFTSGLSWRAFYMGTLAPDEHTMRLQGYVLVTNNSGEDYENAQTRLVVGKLHILDDIAELANRQWPYGRPGMAPPRPMPTAPMVEREEMRMKTARSFQMMDEAAMAPAPKEITKEGLSEYFLYTIEGTETIPDGWSKRLPSFDTQEIPVANLYKHDTQRWGDAVVRFLSFKNDEDHELGETPIPGGDITVYRTVDAQQHLSYEGKSEFRYIPVDEDVELNLGAVQDVVVEPTLMDYRTDRYMYDHRQNIIGWDEIRTVRVELRNTRELPVRIEVKRHFDSHYWELVNEGDFGVYKKEDADTVEYTIQLAAGEKKTFTYTLTTHHGRRQD